MEAKIKQSGQGIKSFLTDLQAPLAAAMCRAIENQLEADVPARLYRDYHERKAQVSRQSQATGQRCSCQAASHFMRNGHL
jgi:hypothetical protein